MKRDWFDRAARRVLALEERDLVHLAVPIGRAVDSPEERVLSDLALLDLKRRDALADPARSLEDYRRLLAYFANDYDKHPHAHGYGARIAAVVRKRPQPGPVTDGARRTHATRP